MMQPRHRGWCAAVGFALAAAAPAADPPAPSVNSVGIRAIIIDARPPGAAPTRVDGFLRYSQPRHTETGGPRSKQLAITLNRQCREDLGELRVQWRLVATDAESHKQTVVGSGEVPLVLTNLASVCMTSEPPVTVTYTPPKLERVDNRNSNANVGRLVRATGQRMSGWAVQVFQGTTLVGEKYSDYTLKMLLENRAPPKSTPTSMGVTDNKRTMTPTPLR